MKLYFIVYFIIFLAEYSLKADNFLIKDVKGKAYYWFPFGTHWVPLKKGLVLKDGVLLSISENSQVSFSMDGKKSLKSDKTFISIKNAIDFRLERDLLRKIKFREHVFSKVPTKVEEKHSYYMKFQWAFKRILASIFDYNVNKDSVNLTRFMAEKNIEVGRTFKKINIFTPLENQFFPAVVFPEKIKLHWNSNKNDEYNVFFWKVNHQKPNPYLTLKGDSCLLDVFEEGVYYIQITSKKGFSSKIMRIYVYSPDEKIQADFQFGEERGIKLNTPGDNSIFWFVKNKKILFSWKIYDPDLKSAHIVLSKSFYPTRSAEYVRHKIHKNQNSFSIKSPWDKFYWWIEISKKDDKNDVLFSQKRSIFIYRGEKFSEFLKKAEPFKNVYISHF